MFAILQNIALLNQLKNHLMQACKLFGNFFSFKFMCFCYSFLIHNFKMSIKQVNGNTAVNWLIAFIFFKPTTCVFSMMCYRRFSDMGWKISVQIKIYRVSKNAEAVKVKLHIFNFAQPIDILTFWTDCRVHFTLSKSPDTTAVCQNLQCGLERIQPLGVISQCHSVYFSYEHCWCC